LKRGCFSTYRRRPESRFEKRKTVGKGETRPSTVRFEKPWEGEKIIPLRTSWWKSSRGEAEGEGTYLT